MNETDKPESQPESLPSPPSTFHSKKGRSGPPGNKNVTKHGYYALVKTLKKGDLDRRTAIGRYQKEKEIELANALGGDPSPQQQWLITDTVRVTLYVASIDAYLVGLKSAVRKGKLHPVLKERSSLAAHIRENLKALGLERKSRPLPSVHELLAEPAQDPARDNAGEPQANRDEKEPKTVITKRDFINMNRTANEDGKS